MALDESALSELLAALRAGEGTGQVRTIAEWVLQQLIELEATERIGAGRYRRDPRGALDTWVGDGQAA